ncbi:PfkB family carbohydrate kinase [Microbacterium koreense]|uniref:Ribokinase n=1 Tax=Microbacterium koreense TaxID=323761 RepID=A0ABW2ZMN8_9MICO
MRVFVVGSINIDSLYRVHVLPGPGETAIARAADENPGGKGANQAVAAASGGASVVLVGAAGYDSDGTLAYLRGRGVDVGSVSVRPDAPTGRALVFVDDASENSIVVIPGANCTMTDADVEHGLRTLSSDDVVVLQSEISEDATLAASAVGRRVGARVIWNAAPVPADAAAIPPVDLLVVNEHELRAIAVLIDGTGDSPRDDATSLAQWVATEMHCDLVCTQGAEPSIWVTSAERGFVSPLPTEVVDTTAAGDTVVGYLAALVDRPLAHALRVATAAAAITVSRAGASSTIPLLADVEAFAGRASGESANPRQ